MTPSHRLVPVEATEEMIQSCYTEPNRIGDQFRKAGTFRPAEVWRAMIAAAPQPPARVTSGGGGGNTPRPDPAPILAPAE